MANKKLKVGVLGLGLIGGSILKSLFYKNKYTLFVVSKSSYKDASNFCCGSSDKIETLKDCDVVFVCSKMSETKENLYKLQDILPNKTIVTDVCSIKNFLPRNFNFNFISSHPMAGTELSGFENSDAELFKGAKWIIEKDNSILNDLIVDMGASPVLLNREMHDVMAAEISHFPALAAFALFNAADDKSRKIAASGFRDMTRLCLTNKDLAYDMLNLNRKNIVSAYKKFVNAFDNLLNQSEIEFKNSISLIAEKRAEMYDKNGKNVS